MVQNVEIRDGYWVCKLKTPVGRSKMTNRLHISPVLEESMDQPRLCNIKYGTLFSAKMKEKFPGGL